MVSIKSLDLNDFYNDKSKFSNDIGSAFEEIGFVIIKKPGISCESISNIYKCMHNFFSCPTDIKLKYHNMKCQFGYTPLGLEHAKGSKTADNKEFLQFNNKNDQIIPIYFNNSINELFNSFENLGSIILKAIAIYLGLTENYFDEMIHNGESVLRCLHYPPLNNNPISNIRAEQHEDINLITLLVGASAEGLEVLSKKGTWIPINPPNDHIVINVGDMLQRLTNNKLKSTTHRVIIHPNSMNISRYSLPFFLHPKGDTKLNCLESCINENNPKSFEDITAREFLNQRLGEIGLAPL